MEIVHKWPYRFANLKRFSQAWQMEHNGAQIYIYGIVGNVAKTSFTSNLIKDDQTNQVNLGYYYPVILDESHPGWIFPLKQKL